MRLLVLTGKKLSFERESLSVGDGLSFFAFLYLFSIINGVSGCLGVVITRMIGFRAMALRRVLAGRAYLSVEKGIKAI